MKTKIADPKTVETEINGLIDECGEPQEIAEQIDSVIFDWICCISEDRVLGEWERSRITTLKIIRDTFWRLRACVN